MYTLIVIFKQQDGESAPLDFEIKIEEKNRGENYLSAGEMPLPALYQVRCPTHSLCVILLLDIQVSNL